jgi:hypothetical protein
VVTDARVDALNHVLRGDIRAAHGIVQGMSLEERDAYAEQLAVLAAMLTDRPGVDYGADCDRCHGGEVYDFLGHDGTGHRLANILSNEDVKTVDGLRALSVPWLLDNTRIGTKGLVRIRERVGEAQYKIMTER